MNEIVGLKIIRWDTEKNGIGDIIAVALTLEDGKRVTFEAGDYPELELHIKID